MARPRLFVVAILVVHCIFLISDAVGSTVYRYQDERGRWHFTDKKPKQDHQQLEVATKVSGPETPELFYSGEEGEERLTVANPLFAPVQFDMWQSGKLIYQWVVEARATALVFDESSEFYNKNINMDDYEFEYRLGRPIDHADGQPLRPPIPSVGKFRVSQGFKGVFTHKRQPNLFAVDIAMTIRDQVHAARDGIVVRVKDSYHMGGVNPYFLDKANSITVLHSDNTFALYAHILMGSAQVRLGEKVKAGDPIANAGTSGYSTGPHLHFVLSYNNGQDFVSTPFRFKHGKGDRKPEFNQWLQIKQP